MTNEETTRDRGDLSSVRVVIADDHPIWRSGVRSDLGDNFHVVGEAGDAAEAIEVIEVINATKPDLVLSDLHMPHGGGIKVAKECGEMTNVVMLTVSEAERDLLDAVAAGAVGYLMKSTAPEELRQGLWKGAHGEPISHHRWRRWYSVSFGASRSRLAQLRRCPSGNVRFSST